MFEKRVAALEGGVAALASSGTSRRNFSHTNSQTHTKISHTYVTLEPQAQLLTVLTICEKGDNIVSSSALYGGTYNQFKVSLPRMGIEARFADGVNVDSMESLIDENTKAIYCETIGNLNWTFRTLIPSRNSQNSTNCL